MNPRQSLVLYEQLAALARKRIAQSIPAAHDTLLRPVREKTAAYYKSLYLDQIDNHRLGRPAHRRPGGDDCRNCEGFVLGNLKNIDKSADLKLGKVLEDCFQEFINEEFKSRTIPLICQRADINDNLHMPDFMIENSDGQPIFYLEFKAIFRPFITIAKTLKQPDYECYSHSQTLDVSNGKKLEHQCKLVENLGVNNVIYVYWYDLPCVKGIFWLPAPRDGQNHPPIDT